MKKFIQTLMLAALVIFSASFVNHANAAAFALTPHVQGSAVTWTAQSALLHGASDNTVFLAVGECSPQLWDLTSGSITIMSIGSICGYAAGAANTSSSGQFAPIVTTGGSLFGVSALHWDIGFETSTTSQTGPSSQIVFGAGLQIPF